MGILLWTRYDLEFQFDATKPCRVTVYVVVAETIDDETGCSSFALVHPSTLPVVERRFPQGLGQSFRLSEHDQQGLLDLTVFHDRELVYEPGKLTFPLVIVLEVDDSTWVERCSVDWCVELIIVRCGGCRSQEAAVPVDVRDVHAAVERRLGRQDAQAKDPRE